MRQVVAVLAVGLVALAGCGDDDDAGGDGGDVSAEEQPYVDAMVTSFQQGDEDELTLTAEQSECVAPRWVDTIGVERFEDAGIEPADISDDGDDELSDLGLDEEQGGELYDAFGACDVDVKGLFIESLAGEQDLAEEDRDCLAENFDDDLLRRVMVVSLTGGDDALQGDEELTSDLFAVFAECPGAAG
jgi:hypothetical protein